MKLVLYIPLLAENNISLKVEHSQTFENKTTIHLKLN